MAENPHQPRVYDAVLGGQNPAPVGGVVLGGIEGVKWRLASSIIEQRIAALSEALKYGQAGLELVIQALQDESKQVQDAASALLQKRTEPIAKLALVLRVKPNNADAYNNRGLSRKELGDNQGAIEDYSQAIQIKPDFYIAYYNRGIARTDLGDYHRAIADHSQALRIAPNFPHAYIGRGWAYQNVGKYQQAMADYNLIIHRAADRSIQTVVALAYNNRSSVHRDLGNYQQAIADAN